jgi:hypothetical protein
MCRHPGIWMCAGKYMDVLVMDVEGTDGRERGEDQASVSGSCKKALQYNLAVGLRAQVGAVFPRLVRGADHQSMGAPSGIIPRFACAVLAFLLNLTRHRRKHGSPQDRI